MKISEKIFILFMLLYAFSSLSAKSIEVLPSMICIQNLKPGETFDFYRSTGLTLKIPNHSGKNQYIVEPQSAKSSKYSVLSGYLPLPNSEWISFPSDTFIAVASDTVKVNFQLTIPNDPMYLNQNFEIPINVTQSSYTTEKTYIDFKLGITIKYFVETQASLQIESPPYGVFGVVPNVLEFNYLTPGSRQAEKLTIFNNDSLGHIFNLYTYIPTQYDTINTSIDIPISGNGYWIGQEEWIQPADRMFLWVFNKGKSIKIPPNSKKEYDIAVCIPVGEELPDIAYLPGGYPYKPKFWEAIIMVESDGGRKRFSRIKVIPKS